MMKSLSLRDLEQYVEENIGNFHEKRIYLLKNLKLKTILQKKIHTFLKLSIY